MKWVAGAVVLGLVVAGLWALVETLNVLAVSRERGEAKLGEMAECRTHLLSIDVNGQVSVDAEPMPIEELERELGRRFAASTTCDLVQVYAEAGAPHDQVAAAMSASDAANPDGVVVTMVQE